MPQKRPLKLIFENIMPKNYISPRNIANYIYIFFGAIFLISGRNEKMTWKPLIAQTEKP